MNTQKRLEELRTILRSESMSYDELHELQDLGERGLIDPGDVELLEAAGVPEGGAMLCVGNMVNVGEPMDDDTHVHAFTGTISDFRGDNVVVEDMDGNCFEVSPSIVTLA